MFDRLIVTNFSNIIQINQLMSSDKFIKNIISIISPISYEIISDKNWPKVIKYTDRPKFLNNLFRLPEVTIFQKWNLLGDILHGTVESYFKNTHLFTLELRCKIRKENYVVIDLSASWKYKSLWIPHNMITDIIDSLEEIIKKLCKLNNR